MNQVSFYFYNCETERDDIIESLNPFMNQVSFYIMLCQPLDERNLEVLIPL